MAGQFRIPNRYRRTCNLEIGAYAQIGKHSDSKRRSAVVSIIPFLNENKKANTSFENDPNAVATVQENS